MNERIRELVKKAGGHFSTHNLMSNPVQQRESVELWDDKIEKFAELIVNECAEQVKNMRVNDYGISGAEIIREHFGVEE
jgi:hypothetical protein